MSNNSSKKNTPKKNNKVIEEKKDDINNNDEVYEELVDHQSSIEAAQNYLDKVSNCINTNIVSLLWTLSELWPYHVGTKSRQQAWITDVHEQQKYLGTWWQRLTHGSFRRDRAKQRGLKSYLPSHHVRPWTNSEFHVVVMEDMCTLVKSSSSTLASLMMSPPH